MIFDHPTYEQQPGRRRDFLALYEKEGLPVQKKHRGNLGGFFTTEIGKVDEIVHIWAYVDLADRPSGAQRWRPIPHGRLICRRAENI